MEISKLKPSVSKKWLIATAGIMWTAVGIMLCIRAWAWFSLSKSGISFPLEISGIILAIVVYYFGFSRIAGKNLVRLCQFPDKVCFFAFQAWKSYLLIIFMISLGIMLRYSSLPRQYLAEIYLIIGGALFLGGFIYYAAFHRITRLKKPCLPAKNISTDTERA
jgi:hypothetical protein